MKYQDQVFILDTTLRDGEQSPGASMSVIDKIKIAKKLDRMGVDIIEAGFAIISKDEFQCIQQISKLVKNAGVASLARAKISDIELAAAAVHKAIKPRIHTFYSTSDMHLKYLFRVTREEALNTINKSVRLARNFCEDVEWSAMDATRSSIDFLSQAIEIAISAGAKTINIPDTVGYITPPEYTCLINSLKDRVKNIDKVILSSHCHNDLGLAVANSLAAISAGIRQVECTVNGIGERAGNAAMEEVVMAVLIRQDHFPYKINVNPKYFYEISKLVSSASGIEVQKNKAIVGENAFSHASGIHQSGLLKYRRLFEIIPPEDVGFKDFKLIMTKHSGRTAFQNKLKALNIDVTKDSFDQFYKKFQQLTSSQKIVSDDDIIVLAKDNMV